MLLVCLNSTCLAVPTTETDKRFDISEKSFPNSYWPITSWNVGFAIVPLLVLPLMEDLGLRLGYQAGRLLICYSRSITANHDRQVAYLTFSIFIIPQAFAQNFATLIIARIFSGGCAGIVTLTLGGIIGDIWEGPHARTVPMNIYVLFYMTGLAMGPVLAGGILKYLNWRWYDHDSQGRILN